MIFAPDDSESLKLIGSLSDTCSCPACNTPNAAPFEFFIDWKVGNDAMQSVLVSVASCDTAVDVNGTDGRVNIIDQALQSTAGLPYSDIILEVGLVGSSALFVSFHPTVSFVQLRQNATWDINPFGLKNDTQTKSSFQFATGLNEVSASFEISGSANVAASVGPIEIEGDIGADLVGSVELSAGSSGIFLPIQDWLSKMKNITLPENAGFARAKTTIDGTFEAAVSAFGVGAQVNGGLKTPFVLDLLDRTAIGESVPDVSLAVDLPDIGDLSSLTFGDVVRFLKVCCHCCISFPFGSGNRSSSNLFFVWTGCYRCFDWRRGGGYS